MRVAADDLPAAVAVLTRVAVDEPAVDRAKGVIAVQPHDGMRGIADATALLRDADIGFTDFSVRRPTLDDVFLNLVGTPRSAA